MPIRIPTYISKGAPAVVDRGGVSPASTGGLVAQGLESVSKVMAGIRLDSLKKAADAERFGEAVQRRRRLKDRIRQLEVSSLRDQDHRTYFSRAKNEILSASAEALDGINDPELQKTMMGFVEEIRENALTKADYRAMALTLDYSRGVVESEIESNIRNAVSSTDARDLMAAEGEIDAVVAGSVRGGIWNEAHGEKVRRGAREAIYTNLAAQLSDQEPERFLSNYQEGVYKATVDPARLEGFRRHAEARKKALVSDEDNQAAGLEADAVWGRLGPVSDTDPSNLDVMEEEISKAFAGNQERAKLARAMLREKAAAHDKGVAERRDANLGAVWGAHADGASINQVMGMPEYGRLPGTDRADVKMKLADRARRLTQEKKERRQEGWDARYYELSTDSDALASMSADQFKAIYPEVGPSNWRKLEAEKRRLTSPEALAEAKIDNGLFKTLAAKAGFDIAPKSERGKQGLANLRTNLMDALVALQKDQGRKLHPDEKEKYLKMLVTRVSVGNEDTFLGFTVTREKPVIEVRNKGNIRVPQDKRKQIIADFKARHGRVPSENQIIDAWIALAQEER